MIAKHEKKNTFFYLSLVLKVERFLQENTVIL